MSNRMIGALAVPAVAGLLVSQAVAGAPGFVREIWVLGNTNQFRVNSPDTAKGSFAERPEAKKDGVLRIDVDQDLNEVESAELYLELWGGHPGVANKRFTLNGKSEYELPEVGAAHENCTYSYPAIPVKVSELRQGENAFTFTCDKGATFWGHYLIRTAALRLHLKPGCQTLRTAGLADAKITVTASEPAGPKRNVTLDIETSPELRQKIASVEYWGRYDGFDENGNGVGYDWHGFTKDGKAAGNVATRSTEEGFAACWSLAMVPTNKPVEVCARVRFTDADELVYETPATPVLDAEDPSMVRVYAPRSLPTPFWSRANNVKACVIPLNPWPYRIEAAQLHVTIWDGGSGEMTEPVTLNGQPLPVAGGGHHDLLYRVVDLDPAMLRNGDNVFVVHSDTAHHGIEVLLPGPALVVRLAPREEEPSADH